jgi:hypothetical protein
MLHSCMEPPLQHTLELYSAQPTQLYMSILSLVLAFVSLTVGLSRVLVYATFSVCKEVSLL